MKVYVKGTGTAVDLTQRDFVASGGQAQIFARRGVAYKVYHDPTQALPIGKIQELALIKDPRVKRPQDILVDKDGRPIGYTTEFISDAHVLCQLFPPSFRKREGVTPGMTQDLVRQIQEGVVNIHSAGILLVDMNEMNFLVSRDFKGVHFIDTDSYQTPHYQAPVLMESVRDWSVQGHQWSPLSDWFSFGVLTFQMFVGIHPFKGQYQGPDLGFRAKLPTDADDDGFAVTRRRMQAHVSVFHSDVKMPAVVLPFDTIPPAYRAWYQAMFTKGHRGPPPDSFGAPIVVVPTVKHVTGSGALDVMEIGTYEGAINRVWSDGHHLVVVSDTGIWLDGARVGHPYTGTLWHGCGFTPKAGRAVGATQDGTLFNLTDRVNVPFAMLSDEVMSHDGRIYIRTNDQVHEVVLTDAGHQVIASTRPAVNILPHATRMYQGTVIQNLLGSVFVSLMTGPGQARQIRIKELDSYKVLDAKFDNTSLDARSLGVLMVVGAKKGSYDRLVFRFDSDESYDVRVIKDITPSGIQFIVMDNGVCVSLTEDDTLEVFSGHKGLVQVKTIDDKIIGADMVLAKHAGSVVFARGNKVYRMKMR